MFCEKPRLPSITPHLAARPEVFNWLTKIEFQKMYVCNAINKQRKLICNKNIKMSRISEVTGTVVVPKRIRGERWEVVSNVLLSFGVMTIGHDEIGWEGGNFQNMKPFRIKAVCKLSSFSHLSGFTVAQ
jgi:hypothetical protein